MAVQQTVSFNFTSDSSAPTLPSDEPASVFRPAEISFADFPRRSAEPLPPIPVAEQHTPPPEIAPSPPIATSSPTRNARRFRSASLRSDDDDEVFVSADPAIASAASEPALSTPPSTSAGYIEPIIRIADPIGVQVAWPDSEFDSADDDEDQVIYEQTGF